MARQDLANEYNWGVAHYADALTADANGSSLDCRDCGPEVTCIVNAGTVDGGSMTVELQESSDNSTFTSLFQADGTTQETMTAIIVSDQHEVKTFFNRSARYVRAVVNILAGTPSFTVAISLGARKVSY